MKDQNNNRKDDDKYPETFELTASEKKALESLPLNRIPNPDLEDRVVGVLRDRGILVPPRHRVIELTTWRIAFIAAACLVLLAAGFSLGQWVGGHQAVSDDSNGNENVDISVAAKLQQTGSAYLMALQRLANLPETADSVEVVQGREVALSTLFTAADHITRLVPKNELAGQLLVAIEGDPVGRMSEGRSSAPIEGTRIIEF